MLKLECLLLDVDKLVLAIVKHFGLWYGNLKHPAYLPSL